MGAYKPEREAKPLGIILLQPDERAEFDALTTAQKGYFLHWARSNPKCWRGDWWNKAMRKAKEQRA